MSTQAEVAIENPTLLRDLSEERFAAIYDCDRFTATVLSNRLRYSVQHVATGLLHRAFSPIIALAYDFAVAVCGPPEQGYQMSAVTNALTVFLGTMADGVRVAVEEYGPERLQPGDLLICNDPSRMGNHPNDLCFIRPVFHAGKLASFVVLRAHQIDIGGVVPGGFSGSKRNTYENGLVISPRLLYSKGEPVRETFSLIFDNARLGQMLVPDFKTTQSCCVLGEELVQESIARYGIDAYLGTLRYCCDATAESMRTAFESLPDGEYEGSGAIDADGIDASEEYRIHVRLSVRGSKVEADFSGSSRQARTSINGGALDAKTAVGVGLKMLLDPFSEFTSGSFRDIDIVIPPGTMASALPPEGAIMLYWEVGSVIMGSMLGALADALGEKAIGGDTGSNNVHNAFGTGPDGTPWACSSLAGGETGPWGADRN
ncbi:MAG: hydantoinase B/oxoprolinase family protein, partial [Solirubrobacterales bacterium]